MSGLRIYKLTLNCDLVKVRLKAKLKEMTDHHNDTRSLRTCYVRGDEDGMLGLHLSRAPWDPYPWVSGVQVGSSAAAAGICVGDCVLEVNGADVLGEKIVEVAERIRSNWSTRSSSTISNIQLHSAHVEKGVTFLLWNSNAENNLNPHSLQKFTNCLQNVAQLLECPICLDVVKPPAYQCCHGHVLCSSCRGRSTRCPICRVTFGPRGRCLIADKLFTLLAETFPCESKETKPHTRCSPSKPCSRDPPISQPRQLKPISKVTKSTQRSLQLYCPAAGKACTKIMGSVHEVFTHLQKVHRTAVTQYYAALGDRTVVRFGTDRTIAAVAIPKNGHIDLFLVVRHRLEQDEDACWVWFAGESARAGSFHVRLECGRNKWRGITQSLESSLKEVLTSKLSSEVQFMCIESSAPSVVVEIK